MTVSKSDPNISHCGWCKAEFSASITPVFSLTWSFRTCLVLHLLLLLSMLKTVVLFNVIVETVMHFFFRIFDE